MFLRLSRLHKKGRGRKIENRQKKGSNCPKLLTFFQYQSFQVGTFGEIQGDGMIGCLE